MKRRDFLAAAGIAALPAAATATVQHVAKGLKGGFDLAFADGRVTRLRWSDDHDKTDYVAPGHALGAIDLTARRPGGGWQALVAHTPTASTTDAGHVLSRHRSTFLLDGVPAVQVASIFERDGADLLWSVELENLLGDPVELGTLALPLPMNTHMSDAKPLTSFVLKHSFLSGAGSFLYWLRADSASPFLLMTPEPGTAFEYWDHHGEAPFRAFIHSTAEREAIARKGGTWRLPASAWTFAPHGHEGSRLRHAVRFRWADGHAGVRNLIAARGLPDIDIQPGMTVPVGWDVDIAVRSTVQARGIEAEHPGETAIEERPARNGRQMYRVRFARLGENRLSLVQANGGITYLEFFATEPIETLLAKRGAFIARHQHRDPTKWYDGLFAEWNASSGVMLGPDDYDRITGWRIYEVSCDDPGLSKPAFLASKNAEYPEQGEVDALDRYIAHFVWGGLQRTDDERYPFGIYGIPDWKRNRESADAGPKGRLHIWRPYDYPHIVCLYVAMWRIARHHSQIRTRLSADTYLDRAAGTAIAMFTVPDAVVGWSAYETGFYNECVIPDLIVMLEQAGRQRQADILRSHWERKVDFFVRGRPNLFGSEYAFDSTGFESTQKIASYALAHAGTAGLRTMTAGDARRFAAAQIRANIFCRGSIEPAYYLLGSDYRGSAGDGYTLSYMAQMGGWAILDHALAGTDDASGALLRLGYQSYLSSFALINSGTARSGYGYWFPGAQNDGSAGGGFEPAAYGHTWLDQPHHRGSWYYSCEIDLGFCGALRTAATIVVDDAIFGRSCLGGTQTTQGDEVRVVPKDGVRRRFHVRLTDRRFDLLLSNDRFSATEPLIFDRHAVRFAIDSADPAAHQAALFQTLAPGLYDLRRDDGWSSRVEIADTPAVPIALPVGVEQDQRRFTLRQGPAKPDRRR